MSGSRGPEYRAVSAADAEQANRHDWDRHADEYQADHGAFLGDARFVWCPEGVDESDARLLGDIEGRRVLELGCGAAQSSRWLQASGATAVGIDLSHRQLQHSRRIDEDTGVAVPVAQASALALPFADDAFDIAFSAFGAMSFAVDLSEAFAEVVRVLRPGARFVFSIVHPSRWMFPDDPSRTGLHVTRSYFDRRPYVETGADGRTSYVEPHHTLEDWISGLRRAGLRLDQVVEPPWPAGHDRVWGGWGPERGAFVPGTAIMVATVATGLPR